jgi:hypothetical protein
MIKGAASEKSWPKLTLYGGVSMMYFLCTIVLSNKERHFLWAFVEVCWAVPIYEWY